MISAIQKSIAELQQWMSWAQKMPTADELRHVLLQGQTAFEANRAWKYAIFETRRSNLWEAPDCTRRIARILSRSPTGSTLIGPAEPSQQLQPVPPVEAAFMHLGEATHIAIRMDQANGASAAIPRKLGFTLYHDADHAVLAKGHTGRRFVWVCDRMS